jgi:hypothetical protein
MSDSALQSDYFEQVAYRDPMHPVVSAYADPRFSSYSNMFH